MSELRRRTTLAFAWSLAKSLTLKLFALGVFFFMARWLSPIELGVAHFILLLLALAAVVGEFGFGAAIVQAPRLESRHLNLPFMVSLVLGLLASVALFLCAAMLAERLKAPQAVRWFQVAALVPPLTAAAVVFQALMRRELDFAQLARTAVVASLTGGLLGLTLAASGWGTGALVGQAVLTAAVQLVLVVRSSAWRPSPVVHWPAFRELGGVGIFVFGSALLDFGTTRLVDFAVVASLGAAALGIYAVGAKLYLTLLDLLAAALVEVGASAMARMRNSPDALRLAHLRLIQISSCTTAPAFLALALLAPELLPTLFGSTWSGAVPVATALGLLGAVQSVQFFNGALLLATGRSGQVFLINLAKLTLAALALFGLSPSGISEFAVYFVISQLMVTPLSFWAALRVTGSGHRDLLGALWCGLLAALFAALLVQGARALTLDQDPLMRLVILTPVYVVGFGSAVAIFRGRKLWHELTSIYGDLRPTKN